MYKNIVLLCNDQNKNKFKLSFIYILGFMKKIISYYLFVKMLRLLMRILKGYGGLSDKLITKSNFLATFESGQ